MMTRKELIKIKTNMKLKSFTQFINEEESLFKKSEIYQELLDYISKVKSTLMLLLFSSNLITSAASFKSFKKRY